MRADERLSLAAQLYEPCMVGADIGTDHAYLPVTLLQKGICRRMLLCDVSPSALAHAAATVSRFHLEDRTRLMLCDGLSGLAETEEPCGCVSVTGMGGQTMADILRRGQHSLRGAVLVLSAHTELNAVRQAVADIGYHLAREQLCEAAGRMYIVWRAEPGQADMSPEAIRRGELLWQSPSPLTRRYAEKRLALCLERQKGLLLRGGEPGEAEILAADIAFYRRRMAEGEEA